MELSAEMEALAKVGMSAHHQENDRSSRNSSSGGSSTSEKSRMLDITRDKPIKVAVRVAVPVRDHPKFNFVGKLLGPKGNSMKRLQEETMCKMAVLGRGSMRDRKKEEELRLSGDPRYSHLSEDLHVEISTFAAPAEAHARIAYALAEVRRFLVPDYHDDIRQEQMWEMQALNTSQNPGIDSTNGSDILSVNGEGILGGSLLNDHNLTSINNNNNSSILNNNSINCESNMQIDLTHNNILTSTGTTQILNCNNSNSTSIATNTTNNCGMQTLTSSVNTNHNTANTNGTINLQIPNNDIETQTVTLLETPLLHPALRGVKTVNIGSGLARKRPLLGVPRSSMNPTKRTVMTLLARAKNSQALHNARVGLTTALGEPIQMITSPLILQQPLDMIQHNTNGTVTSVPKENLLQGV